MNPSVDQYNGPIQDSYKVWFDITLLVSANLLLFPLWVLLCLTIPVIIWLGDRGPVFYKQERVGRNGKIITIRKFRTMVLNADRQGPAWTTKGDPRITPFGKILRRTALDELPELLSIWKRDMTFVGPRALHVEEQAVLESQIPGFAQRLRVLPGLTGMAQVYDPADNAHDKLRYDLMYLQHMSLALDLKLLVLSVRNTLAARWDRRGDKPMGLNQPPSASLSSTGPGSTQSSESQAVCSDADR